LVKPLLRCGDFSIFENGGLPPSGMDLLFACLTTHKEHLMVFNSVQNLFESSFDNMEVLIFCVSDLKTPIHAPKMVFWEI